MDSSTPYGVALRRGLISAVLTGALTFFTVIASTHDAWLIVSVTGVAALTPLVVRFGFEGTVDTRAAKEGGDASNT